VRWVTLSLLAAMATPAPGKPPARDKEPNTFWRRAVEPHADRVKVLRDKARNAMQAADTAAREHDAEWAVDQRQRFYTDAYNLLRQARRLAPENPDVLGLFARAAEELGKIHEAIEALETSIKLTGPDKAASETLGRLGGIYLRMGDRDTAIRWLRHAQTPNNANPSAIVHLATALASRGEMSAAFDALQNALPARSVGYYYTPDLTLIAFTLAVVYDRDEQHGAAFEVLEHMQTTLTAQYAQQVGTELFKHRFSPAEDEHYFRGLLYESLGHFTEARAAWSLYAASGDARWRSRALEHIAAIDKQRRMKPTARPAQPAVRRHP
jgi:tetratricopeptide (TPR) repeat protein